MVAPAITYTFAANTPARAAQVNKNFQDLVDALTLGTADISVGTVNGLTLTSSTGTFTLTSGKTLTCSNTLTLAGTDGSSVAFGAGGTVVYTSNKLSALSATTSSELAGVISDETGSGALVFATSPTLVTPVLGTPSSGTLTSCTGLPLTSGVTGVLPIANGGTNSSTGLNSNRFMVSSGGAIAEAAAVTASRVVVADSNGLPTAASTTTTQVNYLSSATGTTGTTSTNLVFSTSPTLVTPTLGAATATSINGLTITSSTGSLTITSGKTLSCSNTLTLTGTDSSSVAFGAGGTVAYTSNKLSAFAATSSSELAGVISDETGSGALVFGTSPTIASPTLSGAITLSSPTGGLTYGTWSPTVSSSSGTTATPTVQHAMYQKIGDIVFAQVALTYTKNATSVDITFTLPTAIQPTNNFASNVVGNGPVSCVDDTQFITGQAFTSSGTKSIRVLWIYSGSTGTTQTNSLTLMWNVNN